MAESFRPYPVGTRVMSKNSENPARNGRVGEITGEFGLYLVDFSGATEYGYEVIFDSNPAPYGWNAWVSRHDQLIPLTDPDAEMEAEDAAAALDAAYSRRAVA